MIDANVTGDDRVIARLSGLSTTLRAALVDSLKRQWFRIQTEVVREKLSGDPLHRRTGVLATSINVGQAGSASEFVDDGATIIGRIGTKVRYGAVHENGGTFQIPEHVRRISSAFGRQIAARSVEVRAHDATYPQRSFLRSTIGEQRSSVLAAIEADMARAVKDA